MNTLRTSPKRVAMAQHAGILRGSVWRIGLPIACLASVLFGFGLAACTDKDTTPKLPKVPPISSTTAEPSTQVLGVTPAEPSREKAATTAGAKTDMTPGQESREMPMPKQANDHSVEKPKSPQSPASR